MEKFEHKKLSKIINEKQDSNLTYADLLSTIEWKEFRDEIVKRDNWECTKCGEKQNRLAWELTNSSPSDIFVRQADEFEKKYLGQDIIYSSEQIILNAHHKYYIKDTYPWNYEMDALITVCAKCHTKIHETENILLYQNKYFDNPIKTKNCSKCSGTGYLDQYHYFMNGICFLCDGKGIVE
jgi:ribosomal protein S27AE